MERMSGWVLPAAGAIGLAAIGAAGIAWYGVLPSTEQTAAEDAKAVAVAAATTPESVAEPAESTAPPGPRPVEVVIEEAWSRAIAANPEGSSAWQLYESLTARTTLGLHTLGALSPVPVFRSGPHGERLNAWSERSFGHYDPEFVRWASATLVPEPGSELQKRTQPFYDARIRSLARTYLDAGLALQANAAFTEGIAAGFAEDLADPAEVPGIPAGELARLDGKYGAGPAFLAAAFWIRRTIDGTADEFMAGLERLMTTFDAEHLALARAAERRTVAPAPPRPPTVRMALLGEYHGDEVTISEGPVLMLRAGGSALEPATIEITAFHDGIMDAAGEATGRRVSLPGSSDTEVAGSYGPPFPLFLSGPFESGPLGVPPADDRACIDRMLARTRTGEPETPEGGKKASPSVDDGRPRTCTLHLDARAYSVELGAIAMVEVEPGDATPFFEVTIADGDSGRQAFRFKVLEWVGDLDRDGRLDLLTENADHYNVMRSLDLLLSSRAAAGAIAGSAATFRSVGC